MHPSPSSETASLSLPLEKDNDAQCVDFEKELHPEHAPRIEDYLPKVEERGRPQLLRELLRIELECRRKPGEQPDENEYRRHFPDYPGVLDGMFPPTCAPPGSTLPYVPDPDVRVEMLGIPGYEIREVLGRGGMGVVYRAFDFSLNMEVALKLPLPGRTGEHCLREARSIARLRHPNIVQVYTPGEHAGQPYFTMTLIEGPRLDDHVAEGGRDPRVIVELMVKVARAVHHAHPRGILHRDLKPANILLDNNGEPHVSDFGLATEAIDPDALAGQTASESTDTGSHQGLVGTLSFMSPEQATPPREVTTVSDVYGLGAVLYALLTGRPPFQGGDPLGTWAQVRDLACTPASPRTLNARVDRNLEAICLKCLDKDPARRYRSAEGLARDLERWLAYDNVEARPLPILHPERVTRWCRRNPGWASLTVAAVVLLGLSTVLANLGAYVLESRAIEAAGQSNTRAAEMVADNVRWLLRELSSDVVEAANSEDVRDLLRRTRSASNRAQLQAFYLGEKEHALKGRIDERFRRCNAKLTGEKLIPFATFYFLNRDGRHVCTTTAGKDANPPGRLFDGRDYFIVSRTYARQKRRGMEAVHIARVFKSLSDGYYKFSIAVPVVDTDESFLGVLSASLPIHRNFGLSDKGLHHQNQEAVLVGRVDQAPPTAASSALTHDYHVLLHDAFENSDALRKTKLPFTPTSRTPWPERKPERAELLPRSEEPIEPDSRFKDPLADINPKKYGERRLAGFARVGNTELLVIVQQRYRNAVGEPVVLAKTFVWSASALLGACVLAVIITFLHRLQRRQ